MWIRGSSLVFLWLWASASIAGDSLAQDLERFHAFSEWSDHEQVLLKDLSDGQLDSCSLVEAALLVAGHDRVEVDALHAEFLQSCRRCRASLDGNQPVSRSLRIRQLFRYFATHHLNGKYTPDLGDIGATISAGEFNCLSATILFRCLCEEFEITVQAAWEPSHVRCWIGSASGRSGYLVETTAESPNAGVSGLFPKSKLSERLLSTEQLLGKVFYNRGVRMLHREKFSRALTATWASCLLDPRDTPAQNNLRACLNNWALAESQRDDFQLAIQLLVAGMQLDPNYEPFSRNLRLLQGH